MNINRILFADILVNVAGCLCAIVTLNSLSGLYINWIFWLKSIFISITLHVAILFQLYEKLIWSSPLIWRSTLPLFGIIGVGAWMYIVGSLSNRELLIFCGVYAGSIALINLAIYKWAHLQKSAYESNFFFNKTLFIMNADTLYGATLIYLLNKVPLKRLILVVRSSNNRMRLERLLKPHLRSVSIVVDLTEELRENLEVLIEREPPDILLCVLSRVWGDIPGFVRESLFESVRLLRAAISAGVPSINLVIPWWIVMGRWRLLFEQIFLWLLHNKDPKKRISLWYVWGWALWGHLENIAQVISPFSFYWRGRPVNKTLRLGNIEEALANLYVGASSADAHYIKRALKKVI